MYEFVRLCITVRYVCAYMSVCVCACSYLCTVTTGAAVLGVRHYIVAVHEQAYSAVAWLQRRVQCTRGTVHITLIPARYLRLSEQ